MDMFAHGITYKEQLISEDTKAEYLMKRNEVVTAAIADKKVKYNKCVVHPCFFQFLTAVRTKVIMRNIFVCYNNSCG